MSLLFSALSCWHPSQSSSIFRIEITFVRLDTFSMAHIRQMIILFLTPQTSAKQQLCYQIQIEYMKNDFKFSSCPPVAELPNNRFGSGTFELKILDRRTNSSGRTEYKVRWPHDNYRTGWEPLTNLRKYYAYVKQFQKGYEDRITNWEPTALPRHAAHQQTVQQNNICFGGIWRIKSVEDPAKTWSPSRVWPQNLDSPRRFMKVSSQGNQFQKQRQSVCPATEELKFKQMLTNEEEKCLPLQQVIQHDALETYSQLSIQQQNARISRYIKKPLRKTFRVNKFAKGKRSFFKNKRAQSEEQGQLGIIKQIKIGPDNYVFAIISTSTSLEKHMLRDELRILDPEALLLYYEKELASKAKKRAQT